MICNAQTIPIVDPMMVRRFTPSANGVGRFGGVIVMDDYDVEEVGMVASRMEYDEDVVDCSNRIFDITSWMMLIDNPRDFTVFPSRRWRNLRYGNEIKGLPSREVPLYYIGNPIRLLYDPKDGITVVRSSEFLIKSGVALGY